MKTKYFVVLSSLLFLGTLKAQDTLVTLEGKMLIGKIIEFSEDFTSYSLDTIGNEVAMTPSQQFMLIKQGDKVIKSYKNDTLITKDGLIIPCKIVAIDPDIVSFFQYNYRVNSIQSIMKGNILMVKFSDGTKERFDQVIIASYSTSSYELGREDAKNYYKPEGGMIVGEVLLGLSHVLIYPAVAGTVIAYVTPKKLSSVNNPNNLMLSTDAAYKDGYLSVAKKKKRSACSTGFLSGMAAFWATILISINYL
jgi:hypothetical protein